jgi:DNA polymerase-1
MPDVFGHIGVWDFEYEVTGGEYHLQAGDLPRVLCAVAYVLDEHLQHIDTIRLWRGEFGPEPPFDVGPDTLFVAYSAWADLTCFMTLGWRFPAHVFDLHTAYLATSNILLPYDPDEKRKRRRKRLPDACRTYGIEGWEQIDKESIAEDIGNGHWQKYGKEAVLEYCEEDVKKSVELLRAMLRGRPGLPSVDPQRVIWWSEYSAKCVAQIQARGMPIDLELWNLVQENKAAVIGELLRRFDPSFGSECPIYTPEGEWSYTRFEQWLIHTGVTHWPRLESGRLDTDADAFGIMAHVSGVEKLHALRDSLGVIVRAKLPIGADGRNRPSLFPFCTATGRNAHAKSLFNAHAGMRSFMVAPADTNLVYFDWRTQEIGVVAAHAEDRALMQAYTGGDVYHAFALSAGLTRDGDRVHWKKHNQAQRQQMKSLQLGINYGMGVPSLAKGLNRHPVVASRLIEQHKRLYPQFWKWRDNQVINAMLMRRIETELGWPLHISHSPNKRTLINFGAQGNGAEMLRLATVRLCTAGLVPSMLIHDGILIEVRTQEQIEQVMKIMCGAGRDVCRGFEIGVDIDQMLKPGERYCDKRDVAKEMWRTIMDALEAIGAIPKRRIG